MKIYLILFGGVICIVFFAYVMGVYDGKNNCALRTSENVAQQQIHLINLQEDINAETVRRGSHDIRRVLHEKYTIKE